MVDWVTLALNFIDILEPRNLKWLVCSSINCFNVTLSVKGAAASIAMLGHNIISCSRNGELEKLKELLQHEHANVNCTDAVSPSDLMFFELIRCILQDGWTPLMIACKYGNLSCVEVILKYKPEINQLNYVSDQLSV